MSAWPKKRDNARTIAVGREENICSKLVEFILRNEEKNLNVLYYISVAIKNNSLSGEDRSYILNGSEISKCNDLFVIRKIQVSGHFVLYFFFFCKISDLASESKFLDIMYLLVGSQYNTTNYLKFRRRGECILLVYYNEYGMYYRLS